jgi:hypothetical protein
MKFIINISKIITGFRQWMMLKSMRSSFIH